MTDSAAKPDTGRKLFFGLFIFPLLIAVGMAILLCAVVFLTHEQETPETLISAIKAGSPSKRWQKAFELSNELNLQKGNIRTEGLSREMISILKDPVHYDDKTRGYIAIALSHFSDADSLAALTQALGDPSEDVQLYALWALGTTRAVASTPQITPFLKSEKEGLRKTAAYVLGAMGSKENVIHLKPLLDDGTADVRWNAALALARLGDSSGLPTLLEMLERDDLATIHLMNDEAIETAMINAIKGVAMVGDEKSMEIVRNISKHDKSLKVRQAAIDALSVNSHQSA